MSSFFWCVLAGLAVFLGISAFFWIGLYVSGTMEDIRREVRSWRKND